MTATQPSPAAERWRQRVAERIAAERDRQDQKWGATRNHEPGLWLHVLMEEVGEVSKAYLEGDRPGYAKELIEVAAVAAAAAQDFLWQEEQGSALPTAQGAPTAWVASAWPRVGDPVRWRYGQPWSIGTVVERLGQADHLVRWRLGDGTTKELRCLRVDLEAPPPLTVGMLVALRDRPTLVGRITTSLGAFADGMHYQVRLDGDEAVYHFRANELLPLGAPVLEQDATWRPSIGAPVRSRARPALRGRVVDVEGERVYVHWDTPNHGVVLEWATSLEPVVEPS